jgi:hypothetical protein
MGYWFCPGMTAIDTSSPYALEYSLFTARLTAVVRTAAEPAVEEFTRRHFRSHPTAASSSRGRRLTSTRSPPAAHSTAWSAPSTDAVRRADVRRRVARDARLGADASRQRLRARDYRVKNVVLVEVTSCAFPDSVPDIVMTNILAKVPN